MANKRKLKKRINQICETLFTESVAVALYGHKLDEKRFGDLLDTFVKLENHYTNRISHPEPGLSAKAYFKNLRESFNKDVEEIIDQINNA